MIFEATLHQMILFFIMLAIGFVAARVKVIRGGYLNDFSRFIVNILLPAQIIYCTYVRSTRQTIFDNVAMLALAAVFYAAITAVTYLLGLTLRLRGDRRRVFQLCFIFGNTGFVGIPLLAAVFPEHGLLYVSLFTLVDQALLWTMGVYLSTAQDPSDGHEQLPPGHDANRHHVSWRTFVSANTVALIIVFALILLEIPLPTLALDALSSVSNATPALCMIYLGALLYYSDFKQAFKTLDLYVGLLVKMVLLPIATGKLLLWWGALPVELVESFVMIMALPVMTLVPILARKNGHEGDYATGVTVATLVASIATIPFVVWATF